MNPRLLILADDTEPLSHLARRRFGADFDVHTATNIRDAEKLVRDPAPLALVMAHPTAAGVDTLPLLARLRTDSPNTLRCLILDRLGPRETAQAAATAMATGGLDDYIETPWGHPDVNLYPPITDLLARWRRRVDPDGSDAVLVHIVGTQWTPRCHEMRDLFVRNNVTTRFIDNATPEGQDLLTRLGVSPHSDPVVILPSGTALVDPTNLEIARELGAATRPQADRVDVAIVGGGPGGLAAAVYAGSEGLSTVVIERHAIGGQAGTSSHIRNYLGFPHGLSGTDLAGRAGEQAWLFGVDFVHANGVQRLAPLADGWQLTLDDGTTVDATTVIVATGVAYRRLDVPGVERLLGAGVFYGAAAAEARAMAGKDVYIVGAGNSAGQAALHLARHADRVTLVARGPTLERSMSQYLIRDIHRTHNITALLNTQVAAAHGDRRLDGLKLSDTGSQQHHHVPADGLFVMIGAAPHTSWLPADLARNSHGFITTGPDVPRPGLAEPRLPFETSLPGVFAIGDVRSGSVKRVASAVGEGSVSISQIHTHIARLRAHAEVTT